MKRALIITVKWNQLQKTIASLSFLTHYTLEEHHDFIKQKRRTDFKTFLKVK